jgi:hypothetical protein
MCDAFGWLTTFTYCFYYKNYIKHYSVYSVFIGIIEIRKYINLSGDFWMYIS